MDVPVLSDALHNDDEAEFFRRLANTRIPARIMEISGLDGTGSYYVPQLNRMVSSVHDAIYDNEHCDATMIWGKWIHLAANNVGHC